VGLLSRMYALCLIVMLIKCRLFVWLSVCCRFVAVHSTQSDALHLVTTLMKHRLCRVNMSADVCSLFASTAVRPMPASLGLLVTVFDEYGAPENTGENNAGCKKSSSVRSQLLGWLLRCRSELTDDEFVSLPTDLDARLVARVLVALTVRDACVSDASQTNDTVLTSDISNAMGLANAGHIGTMGGSSDIDGLCLLSTFHAVIPLPACVSSTATGACNKLSAAVHCGSSVLQHRRNELLTLLASDIDYSVASANSEVRP